ncbi:exostosin-1-like [Platysternon megacephalum]|uniref:Exostosin-1-like n=1 Tax=Platysternon megacephalum TaxID=55544 RepID=A0A4D9E6V1_9SAUR|nr:exostosin-1-like [Platysternon megacephalum]
MPALQSMPLCSVATQRLQHSPALRLLNCIRQCHCRVRVQTRWLIWNSVLQVLMPLNNFTPLWSQSVHGPIHMCKVAQVCKCLQDPALDKQTKTDLSKHKMLSLEKETPLIASSVKFEWEISLTFQESYEAYYEALLSASLESD